MEITTRTIALLNTAACLLFILLAMPAGEFQQFYGVIATGFFMAAIVTIKDSISESNYLNKRNKL